MERKLRFEALYAEAHADVLRFVARRTETLHRAEDVTHEAFLVAWRRLDDVPTELDTARAWLFGVARGCLSNEGRSVARKAALAVRIAEHASVVQPGSVADSGDVAAVRVDLAAAWKALNPAAQEALSLVTWDGLTPTQAAEIVGVSSPTFRVRLARARAALRRALDNPEVHS